MFPAAAVCRLSKNENCKCCSKAIPQWTVITEHHLTREFKFPDFKQALDFVNKVGELAEEQGIIPISCWRRAKLKSHSGRTRSMG